MCLLLPKRKKKVSVKVSEFSNKLPICWWLFKEISLKFTEFSYQNQFFIEVRNCWFAQVGKPILSPQATTFSHVVDKQMKPAFMWTLVRKCTYP